MSSWENMDLHVNKILNIGIGEVWKSRSDEAKQFIKKLMNVRANERPTA